MNRITTYFSPFYDFARRKLHLAPSVVDRAIEAHATASIHGRDIVLTGGGVEYHAHIGIGHARHATRWVNDFNSRSATFA